LHSWLGEQGISGAELDGDHPTVLIEAKRVCEGGDRGEGGRGGPGVGRW